jgi:hypothetical protein
MIPYERAIVDRLKGSTPKEKHDNLMRMQQLLHRLAFPARGTDDETMTIMDFARLAAELVDQHGEY